MNKLFFIFVLFSLSLFFIACSNDVNLENDFEDIEIISETRDIDEKDILPELIDLNDDVEIGEMI